MYLSDFYFPKELPNKYIFMMETYNNEEQAVLIQDYVNHERKSRTLIFAGLVIVCLFIFSSGMTATSMKQKKHAHKIVWGGSSVLFLLGMLFVAFTYAQHVQNE